MSCPSPLLCCPSLLVGCCRVKADPCSSAAVRSRPRSSLASGRRAGGLGRVGPSGPLYLPGKAFTSLYLPSKAFTSLYLPGKAFTSLYLPSKAFNSRASPGACPADPGKAVRKAQLQSMMYPVFPLEFAGFFIWEKSSRSSEKSSTSREKSGEKYLVFSRQTAPKRHSTLFLRAFLSRKTHVP